HTRVPRDWSSDVCSSDLGVSTRLPDGGRQLIGGWSQDPHRPRVVEYVRADLMAEVLAEVERLSGHLRREISGVDKYDPDIDDAQIGRASRREREEDASGR